MVHTNTFYASSAGFLLLNNGLIYMARGTPVVHTTQALQLIRYDSITNEAEGILKSANNFRNGITASLVHDPIEDYVYLGGS